MYLISTNNKNIIDYSSHYMYQLQRIHDNTVPLVPLLHRQYCIGNTSNPTQLTGTNFICAIFLSLNFNPVSHLPVLHDIFNTQW